DWSSDVCSSDLFNQLEEVQVSKSLIRRYSVSGLCIRCEVDKLQEEISKGLFDRRQGGLNSLNRFSGRHEVNQFEEVSQSLVDRHRRVKGRRFRHEIGKHEEVEVNESRCRCEQEYVGGRVNPFELKLRGLSFRASKLERACIFELSSLHEAC